MFGVRSLILIYTLCMYSITQATDLQLQSPSHRTPMLELYTSEGCSSCPPADQWLSRLKNDSRLWTEVIPLAWHVDYWDYIGWKDPYATAAHSSRQRQYARSLAMRTVYTPGFVLDGKEWRGWFRRPSLKLETTEQAGVLSLDLQGNSLQLSFTAAKPVTKKLVYNVAILGFDLESRVQSGENSGRTLRHDFVVIGSTQGYLEEISGAHEARLKLPDTRVTAEKQAIVAWVSRSLSPAPVQAVGGWIK